MDLGSTSALTIESVRLALNAASLRHKVIADNIANVNTVGHTRMRVEFEDALTQALAGAGDATSASDAIEQLRDARPELVQAAPSSTGVELDDEMVQLSENSLRYHALTRGLSRYLSIAGLIATGTKG